MSTTIKKLIKEMFIESLTENKAESTGPSRYIQDKMDDIGGIHLHSVDGQHLYADSENTNHEETPYMIHSNKRRKTFGITLYPEDGKKSLNDVKSEVEEQTGRKDWHPEIISRIHKDYHENL